MANRFTDWVREVINPKKTKEASSSNSVANILKKVGLAFVTGSSSSSRANFEGPEGFDFNEIENAYLTDSYIRTALDKYVDFMFKAGWDIVGKNPNAVEYVKTRLNIMSYATQNPIDQLLIEIAEELVKYHNVFLIKARAGNSYSFPPGVKVSPIDGKKPVAGYYILPTSTITIARKTNGTVQKYQQEIPGGDEPIEIKPEDIVHIHIDKQPGRAFGFPFIWEALDDIKLLRQMEELVDRMIYKNIFPLLVYQVGLEKEGFQATDEEIEEVRELLGDLTMDGGIILPERHNIKSVGNEGKALQVEDYLRYFEKRVFTGLGVSEMLMGRGDTANRSTSDNMDAAFKDRIKAYQRVLSIFFSNFIVNELLVEGGFDPLMNPEDVVEFRFKEIDFDSKIKQENHAIQKFTQNAITHEELRNELGLDPVDQEDRLYFNMVTAYLDAQAAQEAGEAANAQGDNKDQPENQHGKNDSPSKSESIEEGLDESVKLVKDIENRWELLKAETMESLKKNEEIEEKQIEMAVNLSLNRVEKMILLNAQTMFNEGINKFNKESDHKVEINFGFNTQTLEKNIGDTLSKLKRDLSKSLIKAQTKGDTVSGKVANVAGAFNALKYRLKFIVTTEATRAHTLGFTRAAREAGYKEVYISPSEGCELCKSLQDKAMNLYADKLPPLHPNCNCRLTLPKKEGS